MLINLLVKLEISRTILTDQKIAITNIFHSFNFVTPIFYIFLSYCSILKLPNSRHKTKIKIFFRICTKEFKFWNVTPENSSRREKYIFFYFYANYKKKYRKKVKCTFKNDKMIMNLQKRNTNIPVVSFRAYKMCKWKMTSCFLVFPVDYNQWDVPCKKSYKKSWGIMKEFL